MNKNSDQYFNELKEKLYSTVISDILDDLGYRNQTMESGVRPLDRQMVAVGRAFTVLVADIYHVPDHPYEGLIEALDSIQPGEIYVASVRSDRSAFWGELVSNACMAKGGRGAVIDGCIRDTKKILELNFPVFSKGINPRDCKGRNIVLSCNVPINCAGVDVNPGDLVFADCDGVVIVPQHVEDQVILKALEKVSGENKVRKAIREGRSIKEVFDQYGIL